MTRETAQRLLDLSDGILKGTINIKIEVYSNNLDEEVEKAKELKISGNYDDAINIYLDIFESEGKVNPQLLLYLYEIVMCDCDFIFAYPLLFYAEKKVIEQFGPMIKYPSAKLPEKWIYTYHKDQFIHCLNQVAGNYFMPLDCYLKEISENLNYKKPTSNNNVRTLAIDALARLNLLR